MEEFAVFFKVKSKIILPDSVIRQEMVKIASLITKNFKERFEFEYLSHKRKPTSQQKPVY